MNTAAVMERPQASIEVAQPVVRGDVAEHPSVPLNRKDAARRALLLWSGIDGSCSSPELRESGLFTEDFRCFGPTRTQMGDLRASDPLVGLERGFTERSLAVTRMVEQGDKVISYVRFVGRHTGEYRGHQPTGRLMQADGYVVHRFSGDRIAQEWSVFRWS